MDNALVTLRDVSFSYGDKRALDNVSIQLKPGLVYALLGTNGSGKSSLLSILMRLELATEGQISIFGKSLSNDPYFIYQDVGYVSESIHFQHRRPINALAKNLSQFYPKWDQPLFDRITNDLNLDRTKPFQFFSRGQKSQILFAIAISIRPKLLLLDEVTAVLDPHARSYVMAEVNFLRNQGATILMATNIATEVQTFADQVIILHSGKVILNTSVQDAALKFIKLRIMPDEKNEIFENETCKMINANKDGSKSYIAPIEEKEQFLNYLSDQRGITLEEIFIYYSKKNGTQL